MAVVIMQCTTNFAVHYKVHVLIGMLKKCNFSLLCSSNSVTFNLLVPTMQMMCWN